jgi:hypothetical protein
MSKKVEEEDRSAKLVTDGQRDKLNEQVLQCFASV